MFQVVLSPVAAIGSPALGTGMNPGVKTIEDIRVGTVEIVVDEQRSVSYRPAIDNLADPSPIHATIFGKYENQRAAVVSQISLARSPSLRTEVAIVGILQVHDHRIRRGAWIVHRFIVLNGNFKIVVGRHFL